MLCRCGLSWKRKRHYVQYKPTFSLWQRPSVHLHLELLGRKRKPPERQARSRKLHGRGWQVKWRQSQIHLCVCVCVCARVRVYIHMYIHTYKSNGASRRFTSVSMGVYRHIYKQTNNKQTNKQTVCMHACMHT